MIQSLIHHKNYLNSILTLGIPRTRGFRLAAINITYLPKYIDQLRAYMITKPFDILAINETRLDDTIHDNEMRIHGYVLERNYRNRNGGWVALYIRNTIDYDCDNTLNLSGINLEWLCIKVKNQEQNHFLLQLNPFPGILNIFTIRVVVMYFSRFIVSNKFKV